MFRPVLVMVESITALAALGLLGAITFEVVSFAVGLAGLILAAVIGINLRSAVAKFEATAADLERRMPSPPHAG